MGLFPLYDYIIQPYLTIVKDFLNIFWKKSKKIGKFAPKKPLLAIVSKSEQMFAYFSVIFLTFP